MFVDSSRRLQEMIQGSQSPSSNVLKRVFSLHLPEADTAGPLANLAYCPTCFVGHDSPSRASWPCPTVQVIAEELGLNWRELPSVA